MQISPELHCPPTITLIRCARSVADSSERCSVWSREEAWWRLLVPLHRRCHQLGDFGGLS